MNKKDLLKIIEETIGIITTQANDFVWSHWNGPDDAEAELKNYRHEIEHDVFVHIPELVGIFAPTGSLQEVSISSGWGEKYLELSARFDKAVDSPE